MIRTAALFCHAPIALPQVAGPRSEQVATTTQAMRAAARRLVDARPDVVVVLSPHTPRPHDGFALVQDVRLRVDFARFGAPEVKLELENAIAFSAALAAAAEQEGVRTTRIPLQALDHGAGVPLAFLVEAGLDCPVLVVGLPNRPRHEELCAFGRALGSAAQAWGCVALAASGDCSHRLIEGAPAGFHEDAAAFDRALVDRMRRGDYAGVFAIDGDLRDVAAEDVVDTLTIAAAATGFVVDDVEVLSYEGPFGVGYLVASLAGKRSAHPLVDVAREALAARSAGRQRRPIDVADESAHGVFVTLRDRATGALRGCVGRLSLLGRPLAEAVGDLAVLAATEDPRFAAIEDEAIAGLAIEVSLLDAPVPVAGVDDLDPARAGVLVRCGGKQGVLLPGLLGIDGAAQQLAAVLQKARIHPDERYELSRFDARKVHG